MAFNPATTKHFSHIGNTVPNCSTASPNSMQPFIQLKDLQQKSLIQRSDNSGVTVSRASFEGNLTILTTFLKLASIYWNTTCYGDCFTWSNDYDTPFLAFFTFSVALTSNTFWSTSLTTAMILYSDFSIFLTDFIHCSFNNSSKTGSIL